MRPDADTLADRARLTARARKAPERRTLERTLDGVAERLLRDRLAQIEHGSVSLVDKGRRETFGRSTDRCPLQATVHVRDRRFYSEVAFGGSVGAGESFVAGDWQVDDLTALVRILLVNGGVLDGLDGGWSRLADLARRALHVLARNTRRGSRRNIAAHYDIGNDFFELFLDPTMMYSCAVFERPGMSLEQAQRAKLDRLCRKLDLQPGDHLLEIGTGWGALAIHAARHYGCRVTTTTISREQHALAQQRIDAAGLGGRITLRLDDYRDLHGHYDKLVSVEMIEAVGHQYFDTFFRRCHTLLAPGGTMVLQTITIDDRQYAAARDSVDFIKRHVFPGCCIPSVGALTASMVRASGLRLVDLEDIGPHYATTLASWRERLLANAGQLRARGYHDALLRLWQFYLGYCEGGFAERRLGNVQMVLQDTSRAVPPTPRV
ncbi:MAG TPA: cyclopropane-fatty-acyl-phospholipid synthase family protein [Burkholderiales bacterium]|nr:cyclopropane-fatty-acyl-phospholipid synthase family protein [Burkholderiales bacterium]